MSSERTRAIPELISSMVEGLVKDKSGLSLSKQVELALPQIERARELGVTNAKIIEWLSKQGVQVNPKTFKSALYRARRKQKATAKKRPPNAFEQIKPVAAVKTLHTGLGVTEQDISDHF